MRCWPQVLVRNKLDKYYNDLTRDNVNDWLQGFGDLPPNLKHFALTLPYADSQRAGVHGPGGGRDDLRRTPQLGADFVVKL